MGQTNYWRQPTDFTDKEWDAVVREFKYVCDMGEDYIERVECHESTKNIKLDYISFDAAGCETFYIEKKVRTEPEYKGQDLTFNFCKTGARTVDIFVWHMLTFCQMIKEDFTCSRDWWYWEKPVPIQIVEEAAQLEAKEIKEFGVDAEEIYLGNGSTGRRIKIGGTI